MDFLRWPQLPADVLNMQLLPRELSNFNCVPITSGRLNKVFRNNSVFWREKNKHGLFIIPKKSHWLVKIFDIVLAIITLQQLDLPEWIKLFTLQARPWFSVSVWLNRMCSFWFDRSTVCLLRSSRPFLSHQWCDWFVFRIKRDCLLLFHWWFCISPVWSPS